MEQHTERALGIANRGYLMRRGELVAAGEPDQLRAGLTSLYSTDPIAFGIAGKKTPSNDPPERTSLPS